jgi:hypothetical protein
MLGCVLAFHALRARLGAAAVVEVVARASLFARLRLRRACTVGGVAAALGAGLLVPGCSVGPLTYVGDSSTSAEGDGGDADIGLGPLDGGACTPGDVRTFVPAAYRPATPAWQDVCTAAQLAAFYTACIDSGPDSGTPASCTAFSQSDPTNAACAACILTPDSMSNYGPLIDHGTFITENVGGCIELTDPSGLVCAKAQQALSGCELAACEANCPVHDDATRDAFDQCADDAASMGCEMFSDQASCALGIAEAGSSMGCVSSTFIDFYYAVVPLFCGPPPPQEGGTPPPEAGNPDAAASGDATVDARPGDASSGEGSTTEAASTDAPISDVVTDTSPE